jgi:hypothetical protein
VVSDWGPTYKACLRLAQQLDAAAAHSRELADEYEASARQWHERARERAACCNQCDGKPSAYSCGSSFCHCTMH